MNYELASNDYVWLSIVGRDPCMKWKARLLCRISSITFLGPLPGALSSITTIYNDKTIETKCTQIKSYECTVQSLLMIHHIRTNTISATDWWKKKQKPKKQSIITQYRTINHELCTICFFNLFFHCAVKIIIQRYQFHFDVKAVANRYSVGSRHRHRPLIGREKWMRNNEILEWWWIPWIMTPKNRSAWTVNTQHGFHSDRIDGV